MSLAGRRVLVTGAGGFIGSHLTEALVREGAKVRALVHYNSRGDRGLLELLDAEVLGAVEVVTGDITDGTLVRRVVNGCSHVFHLAALIGIPYSYVAPESYVATNVGGTLNVLEACRDCGVERVLPTSTSEVYGTARYTPIDTAHPLQAQSPYSATKIGADALALSYHAAFGAPVVVVRPFNTFGPRQSSRAVIPTIITQALAGDEVRLGNTRPVRDFLFVEDTARAFLAAAQAEGVEGQVLQFCTGHGVSIGEVVQRVGSLLGRTLRVVGEEERERPEASEVMTLLGSPDEGAAKTGWKPQVAFEEGLERTLRWIERHRGLYRTGSYSI